MIDAKPYQRWQTTSSDGEQRDQIHTFPTISPHPPKDKGHDGVGLSFPRQILQKIQVEKVGTRRRRNTMKYYGNASNRPPKWADDGRLKQTMKTTTYDCMHFAAHSEAIQ